MITPAYCQTMAAYNAWQNKSVQRCVAALSQEDLTKDRGAFFGSIFGTINHLLWADHFWLSNFGAMPAPGGSISESTALKASVADWAADRVRLDATIVEWARKLTALDLTGEVTWFSATVQREMSMEKAKAVAHFFNHQTHHRGQVHAMLTAAGQNPDRTDLPFMPE
ncbi:MAG: DinB family protein [Pseudomonadota bacterium]